MPARSRAGTAGSSIGDGRPFGIRGSAAILDPLHLRGWTYSLVLELSDWEGTSGLLVVRQPQDIPRRRAALPVMWKGSVRRTPELRLSQQGDARALVCDRDQDQGMIDSRVQRRV